MLVGKLKSGNDFQFQQFHVKRRLTVSEVFQEAIIPEAFLSEGRPCYKCPFSLKPVQVSFMDEVQQRFFDGSNAHPVKFCKASLGWNALSRFPPAFFMSKCWLNRSILRRIGCYYSDHNI